MNAVAVALVLLCLEPEYSAKADRNRFPPDAVLLDWYAFSCKRVEYLDCKINDPLSTMRPSVRAAWIEERERTNRIKMALWWMVYPSSEKQTEAVMREWMQQAKGFLTAEEYAGGYIPWGGVPSD